jgi:hypothetical protein
MSDNPVWVGVAHIVPAAKGDDIAPEIRATSKAHAAHGHSRRNTQPLE